MSSTEQSRVMAIKAALVTTTNTQGWNYIKQLANNIVQKTVQESLDEEDRDKGESKRLKAKALQKGFAELFNAIETTKAFDAESSDDAGLGQLELEQ